MDNSPPIRGGSSSSQWRRKRKRQQEQDGEDVLYLNEEVAQDHQPEEVIQEHDPQEESDANNASLNTEDDTNISTGQVTAAEIAEDSNFNLETNSDNTTLSTEDNLNVTTGHITAAGIAQGYDSDSSISDFRESQFHLRNHGEGSNQEFQQNDDSDGDDPVLGDVETSSSSEDEDDDHGAAHNFNAESLKEALNFSEARTVKEALLLDIALSLRHNLTYEATIDAFQSKNILYGKKIFPTQKKELWRVLGRNSEGIVAHTYCPDCTSYVGKTKKLANWVTCPGCSKQLEVSKTKFFVTVSLRKQFEDFLSRPDASDLIRFREKRKKLHDENIEDIFDGAEYERLAAEVDLTEFDLTCTLNLDGCKISKNAKTTIYPLFVRVNEIKPQLRQKFMFLAALFVDTEEPNMNTLLKPVVKEMNRLSTQGLSWKDKTQEIKHSRIFCLCCCVDAKARYQVLNMMPHSGYYSCTYCTIQSIRMGNTQRFPALPNDEMPLYEDRTNEGMKADMLEATRRKQQGRKDSVVRGHKGVTVLSTLNHFDMADGFAADDLHNLYECAVKVNVNLLLTVVPRQDKEMGYDTLCNIIDERMKKIQTPNCISRKPASPKNSIKNREQWKGTQWRDFLLYYGVPCLQNLIHKKYLRHFELLSKFGFVLSKRSISQKDFEQAEKCITEYLEKFEEFYGLHRTRLNMHALKHVIKSCRNLGPYWVYTTFNFESWNAQLLKKITSAFGIIQQIVMRHMFLSHLEILCALDPEVSEDIKERVMNILCKKKRRKVGQKVSENVYLLGNPSSRNPTAAESAALEKENISPKKVQVYPKVIVDSVEYQPPTPGLKSDNSCIYTLDDTFCTLQDIVCIETTDGQVECGLFVMEHDVSHPFKVVAHIACIVPDKDVIYFLKCDRVLSPAIRVRCLGNTYVAAMPNTFGVD